MAGDTTTVGINAPPMVGICGDGGAGRGDRADRQNASANARLCCLELGSGAIGFLIFRGSADRAAVPGSAFPWMGPCGAVAGAATQALMTQLVLAGPGRANCRGATSSVQSVFPIAGAVLFTLTFAYFYWCAGAVQITGRAVLSGLGAIGAGAGDCAASNGEQEIVRWAKRKRAHPSR